MTINWTKLNNENILELRFCDLNLDISKSWLQPLIERLYNELEEKGLKFKPHVWAADEWFAPDGVPGFAVPFYLLHPRLIKLQKKMFLDAEGANERTCMKLLRHECGHALDNAFHLRKSKERQKLFGLSSSPYPESYSPKAYSKKYVLNLNSWYAQAHPDEDWAETFAVWLNPDSNWEKRYENWPALEKLYMVDELMDSIHNLCPFVRNKDRPGDIKKSRRKVKSYYKQKRDDLGLDQPYFLDPLLMRLFSRENKYKENGTAASFIRKERKSISQPVARWTGQYRYTIDLILQEIIESCREKKLYLTRPEEETRMDLVGMLTAQTLNYINNGHHSIPM